MDSFKPDQLPHNETLLPSQTALKRPHRHGVIRRGSCLVAVQHQFCLFANLMLDARPREAISRLGRLFLRLFERQRAVFC